ncbi:sensor domain-containing phosphodiesterase [Qiania dongpingensis]|uniref:sensor domain-containing phosphodiesterase n=1 Tax=Qiania dongpingensis TaxID=2763669 RepID=UPI00201609E4|nr:EAL domain-containing protein [Qiania dongpingensis]
METDINEINSLILDETENMIYISEPETYEIVYLNRSARKNFGITGEEWKGQPCYKLFQDRETPCPFCTNATLKKDNFYVWKHYNKLLGRHYRLYDKLVEFGGRKLRLEICADVTEAEAVARNLELQLSIEETLVKCIHTLSDNLDMGKAINELLRIIGEFYGADRSCLFEYDRKRQILSNTYEWCRDGVPSEIDDLQKLPLREAEPWQGLFREKGEFYIGPGSKWKKDYPVEYQLLESQGIKSMMAVPLQIGEKNTGFIGVENPSWGTELSGLLKSVSYFIQNDISKRKMIERFREQGHVDSLTGIGNRNRYMEVVGRLQKECPDSLGVVFIDINDLKLANDSYGHEYGDRMIQNVAYGLKTIFSEHAYRIGGDEFVALSVNGSREEFDEKVRKLLQYKEEKGICDFSMGSNFIEGDVDAEVQIAKSDYMMYSEKQLYYSRPEGCKSIHHKAIGREMRREIEQNSFQVYLQPQFRLKDGVLHSAEALVRKKDPDGGIIFPDKFISLYEAERVIQHLDMYVFEEACRILAAWREAGYSCVPISINFSRISLMGVNVVKKLADIRDRYQIKPELLAIETTESINKINAHVLRQLMREFAEHDFRFVLDDFGSENSNLAIFTNMNFAELKLDRSLIKNIDKNETACLVVEHMIAMCKSIGNVTCVAEGIETERQLELLKQYSCDTGQGYLFSKPLPEPEFREKYLKKL